MRNLATFLRLAAAVALVAALQPSPAAQSGLIPKLDPLLQAAAASGAGSSPVIVRAIDAASLSDLDVLISSLGGSVGRALPIITAETADVPNAALATLAGSSAVADVALDRAIVGAMERTGPTVGANTVRQEFGYDGSGVGVAVIDSGVTAWHDDLTGSSGGQRVDAFVDFVNNTPAPYDDYGHGTHVAGIIAGNGFDSGGLRAGIAPGARLTVLKVLDGTGVGRISNVIAALGYVAANKDLLNIRVVNLSIATSVHESYDIDPLTLAARAVVTAGVVVVAAAGNAGRDPLGHTMYGGITAPGNAPWVLTVGASSTMGTVDRSDDTIAAFSSRGPTAIDNAAKPDLVAPGVGTESLSDPQSAMYTKYSAYLLSGTVATAYLPYLSLTGTSMSAPVVTGTVALMLQANPSLTPNAVKAILEYTAQAYPGYDALTQGAGFLNARGAVELAYYLAHSGTATYPDASTWLQQFLWGSRVIRGGRLAAGANAWAANVVWGDPTSANGGELVWGTTDGLLVTVWAGIPLDAQNIVWGTTCGGVDCLSTWTTTGALGLISASSDADTVVWGSTTGDTVVWGSSGGDTVVWGSSNGDTVVWGSSCSDPSCQPVVW